MVPIISILTPLASVLASSMTTDRLENPSILQLPMEEEGRKQVSLTHDQAEIQKASGSLTALWKSILLPVAILQTFCYVCGGAGGGYS